MAKVKEVYSFVGEEKAYFYARGVDDKIYFWDATNGKWIDHKYPSPPEEVE